MPRLVEHVRGSDIKPTPPYHQPPASSTSHFSRPAPFMSRLPFSHLHCYFHGSCSPGLANSVPSFQARLHSTQNSFQSNNATLFPGISITEMLYLSYEFMFSALKRSGIISGPKIEASTLLLSFENRLLQYSCLVYVYSVVLRAHSRDEAATVSTHVTDLWLVQLHRPPLCNEEEGGSG